MFHSQISLRPQRLNLSLNSMWYWKAINNHFSFIFRCWYHTCDLGRVQRRVDVLVKSPQLWNKTIIILCFWLSYLFIIFNVCICLCRLQHGALGFSQFSSSSSPLSHTTAPMPYFRGNYTRANTAIPFLFMSPLPGSWGHIITEMPISGRTVSQRGMCSAESLKVEKTSRILIIQRSELLVNLALTPSKTCTFPVFWTQFLATCVFMDSAVLLMPVVVIVSFSYIGTTKSVNSSKSLCGGWLTQKKWESLNFKWVMACLCFFCKLEGVDGLLREECVPTFLLEHKVPGALEQLGPSLPVMKEKQVENPSKSFSKFQ